LPTKISRFNFGEEGGPPQKPPTKGGLATKGRKLSASVKKKKKW